MPRPDHRADRAAPPPRRPAARGRGWHSRRWRPGDPGLSAAPPGGCRTRPPSDDPDPTAPRWARPRPCRGLVLMIQESRRGPLDQEARPMGVDDQAKNKAQEVKGQAKEGSAGPPMTRNWRPRVEPTRPRAT